MTRRPGAEDVRFVCADVGAPKDCLGLNAPVGTTPTGSEETSQAPSSSREVGLQRTPSTAALNRKLGKNPAPGC